ncbi:TadE/TadG family type IV pilus assembly protein [Rhodopila sp.]|uniref:TadE/TadG family type IV pilus assembly protein n=1 Tax=Rhodopila sp. TaxID=2480087 RepID=UPI003D0FB832
MGKNCKRDGVAGLEFALISPVLLILFLGTIDISNALLTARRMTLAAGSVAEIASTSSVQSQALNKLTDAQAWQATTAAFALFPGWTYPPAQQTFAITISGVDFTASPSGCTENCSYTAKVKWSVANDLGQAQLRPCGALAEAPDTDAPSYQALPAGNFGPTSLFVADISYTFRPAFFGFVTGDIPMMQSAYISPRINNDTVLVAAGGAGASNNCEPSS